MSEPAAEATPAGSGAESPRKPGPGDGAPRNPGSGAESLRDVRADLAALTRGRAPGRWAPRPGTQAVRDAAVLVLFGVLDAVWARTPTPAVPADLDVLLLARAATLSSHAGQVAFPGGRREEGDAGPAETALREAVEETGLDAAGVEILGALAPRPVPVSRHRVTPVLAWWAAPSPVRVVDPGESAHVFRAPVADLIDPANRRSAVIRRGGAARATPAFVLPGDPEHLVWGFTGMILSSLLEEAGWALAWDPAREVDPLATDPRAWTR